MPTFYYKENLSKRTFFVKFLEAVTVIREIMIGWETFSVFYNYNLKLRIKLFQTFFLQTEDKVDSRVMVEKGLG